MNLGRVTPHEILRDPDERDRGFEETQPVFHDEVGCFWHPALEVVKRRAEQQRNRVVGSVGAVHADLCRDHGVFRMQQQ